MAFRAKLTDFLKIVKRMCKKKHFRVLKDIQKLLKDRTLDEIVSVLIEQFPKESQEFLLSRNLDILSKLPCIRSCRTSRKRGFTEKQSGVYVCRVLVKAQVPQLYVGMGASHNGFQVRFDAAREEARLTLVV